MQPAEPGLAQVGPGQVAASEGGGSAEVAPGQVDSPAQVTAGQADRSEAHAGGVLAELDEVEDTGMIQAVRGEPRGMVDIAVSPHQRVAIACLPVGTAADLHVLAEVRRVQREKTVPGRDRLEGLVEVNLLDPVPGPGSLELHLVAIVVTHRRVGIDLGVVDVGVAPERDVIAPQFLHVDDVVVARPLTAGRGIEAVHRVVLAVPDVRDSVLADKLPAVDVSHGVSQLPGSPHWCRAWKGSTRKPKARSGRSLAGSGS